MKKPWTRLLLCVGLTALFALGVQGTASATPETSADVMNGTDVGAQGWPTGCRSGQYGNGWYAYCSSSNGGHFKAAAICGTWDGQTVYVEARAWDNSEPSYVSCPPLTGVEDGGFVTKST